MKKFFYSVLKQILFNPVSKFIGGALFLFSFLYGYVYLLGSISFSLFGDIKYSHDAVMSYGLATMVSVHLFGGLAIVFFEVNNDYNKNISVINK